MLEHFFNKAEEINKLEKRLKFCLCKDIKVAQKAFLDNNGYNANIAPLSGYETVRGKSSKDKYGYG
jgi:hypothetical protein